MSKWFLDTNLRGSLSVFTIMSITENSLRPGIVKTLRLPHKLTKEIIRDIGAE